MKGSIHWLQQRFTAVILLFLLPWFAFQLLGKTYPEMAAYFKMDWPKFGLLILCFFSSIHALLGIDVVLDDYVPNDKIRKIIMGLLIFLFTFCGGLSFYKDASFFLYILGFLILIFISPAFLNLIFSSLKDKK